MKRTTEEIIESTRPLELKQSSRRDARKQVLTLEFKQAHTAQQSLSRSERFRQWLSGGLTPKLTVSLSGVAIAIALVFTTTALVTTPLTTERVLAQAASAYEDQNLGRYHYTKTRNTSSFGDFSNRITINEIWEDTETNLTRYQTTTDDGTVLDIFQANFNTSSDESSPESSAPSESYSYVNEDAYNELYPANTELNEDTFGDDFGPDSIIPGASVAGLDFDDFSILSPKQIDDALVAVGEDTYFEKIYGTTNFPGYTLTGKELDKIENFDWNEIFPQEKTFYDGESFVPIEEFEEEASPSPEQEAVFAEQERIYLLLEDVRNATSNQARKELIQRLSTEDSIELIAETDWEGMRAIGIKHSISPFEGTNESSTVYFDPDSFRVVGDESTFSDPLGGESNFRSVVLEDSYSNVEPNFSTDGLSQDTPIAEEELPDEFFDDNGKLRPNEEIEALIDANPNLF